MSRLERIPAIPRKQKIFWWIVRVSLVVCLFYAIFFLNNPESSRYKADAGTKIVQAVAALGLTFLWSIIQIFGHKRWLKDLPPMLGTYLCIFLLLACSIGSYLYFYERIWWFDKVMHMWSGALCAVGGYEILVAMQKENFKHLKKPTVILWCVMFAMSIALLWEIYEFSTDTLLGSNMQIRYERLLENQATRAVILGEDGSILIPEALRTAQLNSAIYDTMLDCIWGTCGGVVATVFLIKLKFNKRLEALDGFEDSKEVREAKEKQAVSI